MFSDVTNAYIVWSLAEAGIDVNKDLEWMLKACEANLRKDSYLMALTSATCYKLNKKEEGNSLAEALIKFQQKDGSVADQETTITR